MLHCAHAKQWTLLLRLFRLPVGRGASPRPLGDHREQHLAASGGLADGAWEWSRASYHAALKACRLLGEWSAAVEIVDQMQDASLRQREAAERAEAVAAARARWASTAGASSNPTHFPKLPYRGDQIAHTVNARASDLASA